MKTSLRLIVAAFGLASFNLSAATLYVSLESTNPLPPFATWATAATNIQDAVDAAQSGDTVLVTNGVYAVGGRTTTDVNGWVSGNRVFITNAIRLESVNGPLTTTIEGILTRDKEGYPIDARRCVYLGSNAVLSGFTLVNGHVEGNGGGVFCEPSGVVTNCTLTGNSASVRCVRPAHGLGGGVFGGTLYNCILMGNWVDECTTGGGAGGSTLYNCTLTGNSASWGGGASECTLYNCTLTGNSASWGGGANSSTLYNCTLTGNSAWWFYSGSGAGGGAWWSTLYNCTVVANSAGGGGGGVFGGLLYNCIVYYNTAQDGANYYTGTWGGEEVSTLLQNSCTTPLPSNGVGNTTGQPLFMDMAAGDFRLREGSPCIDGGTNLMGFTMTITNRGWGGGEPYSCVVAYTHDPTDILGNTRFIDGNFDGIVAWDIGAYEFNSFPPPRFTCAPQRMPDCWRLSISGAPNKWVRIERSSDLKNWEDYGSWMWMGSAGVKQVDDGDTSQPMRFYRVVVE